MVSRDTVCNISSSRVFCVSKRIVQRAKPLGGSVQARAMIFASMSPVMIGGFVVFVRLNFRVWVRPFVV